VWELLSSAYSCGMALMRSSMKIELDDKENPLIVGFLKPERARVQFPHTWETQPSYS